MKINGKEVPDTDKAIKPIESAYGPVSLSWPKNDQTYEDRFGGGGRSTKMILYSVTVPAIGLTLEGSIYARLKPLKDGTGHEIVPDASIPKAVSFTDADSKTAFLAHVETAAIAWAGFDKAYDNAVNRLTGVKAPTVAGKVERPVMAPRLVKATAKVETPSAAA